MFKRSHSVGPKNSASHPELDAAVEQLVAAFHPESIYLFGSLVEGHSRPESSVDILIVAPDMASVRFLERIKRAMRATESTLPTITPLVYTPAEVELLKNQGDGFMTDVLEHAKLLYQKN